MSYGFLHRWTLSARSSVVGTSRPFKRVFGQTQIAAGWRVVDVDGKDLGTVAARESDFLAVSRGLARGRLYVPLTAVREVKDGAIRLNLPAILIDKRRWSERPRGSD
ncbi:MAG: DUF2171 domain-containing protein [Candidatus Limnocylindrales bacterium]